MNKEDIDILITNELKEIKAPQNLKEKVCKEIKQMKKHGNLRKIPRIVAIILIACTFGLTTYAGVTGKLGEIGLFKLSQNYDRNSLQINKKIENEYCNITLESMAGDGAYIVAKYKVELTEKALNEFEKIEYDARHGYNLGFTKKIFVGSRLITGTDIEESIEKVSESKYSYVQIINVMDLEENNVKLEIDLETLFVGREYGVKYNEIEIAKIIKAQIEIEGNLEERNLIVQEQVLNDNTKMVIENIQNTEFETYIQAKIITENLTWKQYNNRSLQYDSFLVDQSNDKTIAYTIQDKGRMYYKKNEDGEMKAADAKELRDNDIVRVEENFTIFLGDLNDITEINLMPLKTTLYNDRTSEEKELYNKATWYQLIEGETKYSATSELGGTLEIEKIEINEENVTFYYNTKGNIGNKSLIILRKNNGIMNYVYPTSTEKKGINGNENKIIFAKEDYGRAGLAGSGMTWGELNKIFEDISDVEFSLLWGSTSEIVGEPIKIEIPTQNESTAVIKNIKLIDE